MIELTLQATANQQFSATLDGSRYDIALREANGAMCVDITRDEVVLVQGQRVVAGSPIIPYAYLEVGNFVLLTENDEIPYYTEFGTTQSLVYLSAAELATLRGS